MKKTLFALAALVVLASSCKKDKDDDAPVTPTNENIVGTYKTSKIVVKNSTGEADITNDMLSLMDACDRDNLHKFNSNNTYEWVDAGTKCSPESTYSDTWTLTNTTTFEFDGETYTIKSFNGKELQLSQNLGGAEYIYTITKQ